MKKVIVVAMLRMVTEQVLTEGSELIHETIQHALLAWSSPLAVLVISMFVSRSWLRRLWQ